MYFQLEVDYHSKKNKYTNFQLISSTKKQLKVAEDQIVLGIVLATTTCDTLLLRLGSTLLLGLVVTWKYIFQVQVMLVWAKRKSLYSHINTIYVNKNQQGHSSCWFPSLSFVTHRYGGITLAWAHCSQTSWIKSCLHHNRPIG